MKMFRNCPEKERNNCDDCQRLKKCAYKKIRRKFKKVKKSIKIATIILILTLLYFFMTTLKCEEMQKSVSLNISVVTPQAIFSSSVATTPKPKIASIQVAKKRKNKRRKIQITKKEMKMMVKVVYAEARGERFKGQVAVASVIFNRYEYNKRKISIKDIILAKNQFANISNITQEMLDEYPDCKRAVRKALRGYDPTRVKFKEGARYFYEPDSSYISEYQKNLRKGVEVLKIGNHYFHNDFNE